MRRALLRLSCFVLILIPLAVKLSCSSETHQSQTNVAPGKVQQAVLYPTIQVQGRNLIDACGHPLVIRGVEQPVAQPFIAYDPNDADTWNNTFEATLDNIALTGANAVRLLFDVTNGENGENPNARVAQLIDYATNQKNLVTYVTAGGFDWPCDPPGDGGLLPPKPPGFLGWGVTADGGTLIPNGCASYSIAYRRWFFQEAIKQAIASHSTMTIVDALPENDADKPEQWRDNAIGAVLAFRDAGYTVPLTAISRTAGRDLPAILQYGQAVEQADPLGKTILGWQAYWGDNQWYQGYYGGQQGLANPTSIVNGLNVASRQNFPIQAGFDFHADLNVMTSTYNGDIAFAAQTSTNWLWWSYMHPLEWPVWQNHLTEYGMVYQPSSWNCLNTCSPIPYGQDVMFTNAFGLHSATRACH